MDLVDGDLRLRALELKDAPLLHALLADSEIQAAVLGWSGPISLSSQEAWISTVQPSDFRYIVELAGEALGTAQISPLDLKNRTAELHLKLLPASQGKGLGQRTIRILTGFLFKEMGIELVSANILENNASSIAAFTNVGFTVDGVLRSRVFKGGRRIGVVCLSIMKDEILVG